MTATGPVLPALDQVRWIDLPSSVDQRGVLTSVESERDIPFAIARIFYMHHIVSARGGHAHRDTHQVLTAVAGRFSVQLSDGERTVSYVLADPTRGLYMPPMLFIHIHDLSPDAVCLVLASTHYDMSRSLRSWDEYLEAIRR